MRVGSQWALFVSVAGLVCVLATGLWHIGPPALALGLICLEGHNSIDRATAMRSGYAQIREARQIDELLGMADHAVMNEGVETDEGVKEEWISEVYFGGRYQLVMTVELRVNRRTSVVSKVIGSPKFRLLEIREVQLASGGGVGVSYRSTAEREFNSSDWERVVEANGDFSVIGIQIENGPPLPGFSELVQFAQSRARLRYPR